MAKKEKGQEKVKGNGNKSAKADLQATKMAKSGTETPKGVKKDVVKFRLPPRPEITRMQAVATILKADPKMDKDKVIEKADKLFTKKTGRKSNLKESRWCYNYAIQVVDVFGLR